jgi:surface protein
MFSFSLFNGDISKWDVSKVKDMRYMFSGADFERDIEDWDVNLKICRLDDMFDSEKLSYAPNWYIEEISDSDY